MWLVMLPLLNMRPDVVDENMDDVLVPLKNRETATAAQITRWAKEAASWLSSRGRKRRATLLLWVLY